MKKILCIVVSMMMLFIVGCQRGVEKWKKEMLDVYSDDNSYVIVTGEITDIYSNNGLIYVIKCED